MHDLHLTLVQANLVWESPDENFAKFEKLLKGVRETDLIILPEMFPTGFSMKPHGLAENVNGPALTWMKKMAAEKKTAICGSVIVKDKGEYFNRLYFVKPDGDVSHYDKRHLFTLAGEQKEYSGGNNHLIVDYKGWKIMPLICYDLRFPVWCRNTNEVDLQLFVANWPERRSEAWKTLVRARAIENMCYIAAVNRVGADGNEVDHSGDSVVYDELGNPLLNCTPFAEEVRQIKLNKASMLRSREKFSFLADRDDFEIKY